MSATQTLESQWGRESLTVAAKVPTVMLRFHLGRVHIATPDDEVLADVRDAIAKAAAKEAGPNSEWTADIIVQTLNAALWLHHENLAEYACVMGGAL